jgi:hypothetical protein
LSEKFFSWEAELLKEVTAEYFMLRDRCEQMYPDCVTNKKPKVCHNSCVFIAT